MCHKDSTFGFPKSRYLQLQLQGLHDGPLVKQILQ